MCACVKKWLTLTRLEAAEAGNGALQSSSAHSRMRTSGSIYYTVWAGKEHHFKTRFDLLKTNLNSSSWFSWVVDCESSAELLLCFCLHALIST